MESPSTQQEVTSVQSNHPENEDDGGHHLHPTVDINLYSGIILVSVLFDICFLVNEGIFTVSSQLYKV